MRLVASEPAGSAAEGLWEGALAGCAHAGWACGMRAKREMLWNITEQRSRASPMGGEASVHERAEERAGGV